LDKFVPRSQNFDKNKISKDLKLKREGTHTDIKDPIPIIFQKPVAWHPPHRYSTPVAIAIYILSQFTPFFVTLNYEGENEFQVSRK
jgi:hypothetical protein